MIFKKYFIILNLSLFYFLDFSIAHSTLFEDLSFTSDKLIAQPLLPKDYSKAQELDNLDRDYVSILRWDSKNVIEYQEKLNFLTDFVKYRKDNSYGQLIYGIHLKDDNTLIGLLSLNNLYPNWINQSGMIIKHYISTDLKIHKDFQFQAYATEIGIKLLKHYQEKNLVPSNDINDAQFLGFRGLVHLTNKPSLNYNILKCQKKIGRFFGDRVEVFTPAISINCQDYPFHPILDPLLHERLYPLFKSYLSRPESETSKAELYKISFQNLISVPEDSFREALESEENFFGRALISYPILKEEMSDNKREIARLFIDEREKTLRLLEDKLSTSDKEIAHENLAKLKKLF